MRKGIRFLKTVYGVTIPRATRSHAIQASTVRSIIFLSPCILYKTGYIAASYSGKIAKNRKVSQKQKQLRPNQTIATVVAACSEQKAID